MNDKLPSNKHDNNNGGLGERFQRIADKAVLRKNGVGKAGPDGLKK